MSFLSKLFGTSSDDARIDRAAAELGMQRAGHELLGQRYGVTVGAHREPGSWRIYGRLGPPLDLGLAMYRRDARPPAIEMGQALRAAHPGLNMTYLLFGDEPSRVLALLPHAAGAEILALFANADLMLTDFGVTVTMDDGQLWLPTLAVATDSVARLTALLHAQRHQVDVAWALRPHLDAWRRFARARGLQLLTAPLGLSGQLAGADVWAYAARVAPDRHVMEVTLRFHEPLGLGLEVRPRGALDLSALFGGEEGGLDDPAFDAAFLTRAADLDRARALLDAPTRQLLASMLERAGKLALSDEGVTVQKPEVPADPSPVLAIVGEMLELATHVDARRRAALSRGAYR